MKSLNKKGFILVETLIVTVFVVTMFIVIYQASVPILGDLEQYNRFEDIDIIYSANMYKQMLSRYGDFTYINSKITNDTYLDISDCNDSRIYKSNSYCNLIQQAMGIELKDKDGNDKDRILLTEYNLESFKITVKMDDNFDSGAYSNFQDYVDSVGDTEHFYPNNNGSIGSVVAGKYRLFLIKNVTNTDGTKTRKYTNVGIYEGNKNTFVVGEPVYVNLTSSLREKFYVLKNSDSTDSTVTLIYSKNLDNSNINFSKSTSTNTPFALLTSRTGSWRSNQLYNFVYYSKRDQYSFDYTNYRARFIDEYDIREALRCTEYQDGCFDPNNAFDHTFNDTDLAFLTDNLTGDQGYWTALVVPNTDNFAWAVKNGHISPVEYNTPNIGVRPIITIDKVYVERGE